MSKKDTQDLLKALQRQGFEVARTAKGHWRVTREGRTVAVLGGTPSDWRSRRNELAALRRAGFCWPR